MISSHPTMLVWTPVSVNHSSKPSPPKAAHPPNLPNLKITDPVFTDTVEALRHRQPSSTPPSSVKSLQVGYISPARIPTPIYVHHKEFRVIYGRYSSDTCVIPGRYSGGYLVKWNSLGSLQLHTFISPSMEGQSGSHGEVQAGWVAQGRHEARGHSRAGVRCGSVRGKFHATQIESLEVGAFFYDIVKLDEKRMMNCARRRRRLLQLNYPEQSLHLNLPDLPPGFHIKKNKDQTQKLILDQARRAARELIQNQSRANTQISSDTVFGDRVFQEFREKACQLLNHCWNQYLSKASERQNLERMVAGISEAPGIISLPNSRPEKFYECVAFIKRIIKRDDHNLIQSISESLIGNQVGKEVEVSNVIRSIAERLVESPKDVLRNPWVSLFFSPDSRGGAWDAELENLSKILNNSSPTWNF